MELIALVKWLNREFGYRLAPRDLEGPNPVLDEHEIDWHLSYSETFNDAELRAKVREKGEKYRKKFQQKGVFSALYEFFGND